MCEQTLLFIDMEEREGDLSVISTFNGTIPVLLGVILNVSSQVSLQLSRGRVSDGPQVGDHLLNVMYMPHVVSDCSFHMKNTSNVWMNSRNVNTAV